MESFQSNSAVVFFLEVEVFFVCLPKTKKPTGDDITPRRKKLIFFPRKIGLQFSGDLVPGPLLAPAGGDCRVFCGSGETIFQGLSSITKKWRKSEVKIASSCVVRLMLSVPAKDQLPESHCSTRLGVFTTYTRGRSADNEHQSYEILFEKALPFILQSLPPPHTCLLFKVD